MTSRQPIVLALAVFASFLAALVAVAPAAGARVDEDDDVRRTGTCTGGSETSLRIRSDDGSIRIELEIETDRPGSRWVVVLLHERRIVFRGALRARSERVRLRRTVRDFYGSDAVLARATGPRGETCRVSATLTEDASARRDVAVQSNRA